MLPRLPVLLVAAVCLLLGLAACASPGAPAVPAGPAVPTSVPAEATEVIVVRLVTATPAAATPAPTSTVPGYSPAAKLMKIAEERRCRWVAYMHLTGFAPNSVITVDAEWDETECPSGKPGTGHWTKTYAKKTDAQGRLLIDYWYEATGSYRYTFTDEKGNQASLPFTDRARGQWRAGAECHGDARARGYQSRPN